MDVAGLVPPGGNRARARTPDVRFRTSRRHPVAAHLDRARERARPRHARPLRARRGRDTIFAVTIPAGTLTRRGRGLLSYTDHEGRLPGVRRVSYATRANGPGPPAHRDAAARPLGQVDPGDHMVAVSVASGTYRADETVAGSDTAARSRPGSCDETRARPDAALPPHRRRALRRLALDAAHRAPRYWYGTRTSCAGRRVDLAARRAAGCGDPARARGRGRGRGGALPECRRYRRRRRRRAPARAPARLPSCRDRAAPARDPADAAGRRAPRHRRHALRGGPRRIPRRACRCVRGARRRCR